MINPDTRVSVHCYEGDGHQVRAALHLYTHHQCPVTVISPVDSRVMIDAPGVESRFAGMRTGSVEVRHVDGKDRVVTAGHVANMRQIAQMRELLTYPENFFLMNDADSMCLEPKLPAYLYAEPDIVWSNLCYDSLPMNQVGYADRPNFPRLAFQPPYFLSRRTIEAMIAVAGRIRPNTVMPWIDHFMVQLAVEAKLVWKGMPDVVATDMDRYPGTLEWAQVQVRHLGRIFVHSAKAPETWGPLMHARDQFNQDYRGIGDHRPNTDTNTTRDVAPVGQERMRGK